MSEEAAAPVKILFVDDEKSILLSLLHLVRTEPFETLIAESAAEGLEILRNTKDIGVVVSDQIMPDMNGVEFLRKAWDLAPDAIRIMVTGHCTPQVENEARYKGGAFRFIPKPWKNDDLIRNIRDAVEIYRLIVDSRRSATAHLALSREKTTPVREKTYYSEA